MKKFVAFLLILTLTAGALSACGSGGQNNATEALEEATDAPTAVVTDALRAELAEEFEAIFTQRLYEGAAYLVYHGEEVYASGTGDAIKADNLENNPDVVYHVASVSKQFTAAAILKLCEEGRLSLDDTLNKYFPAYAAGAKVTIHHLLSMQSGIPDYVRSYNDDGTENRSGSAPAIYGIGSDNTAQENLDALTAHILAQDLLFTPGDRYSYSNSNYVLLGLIAEQESDTGFHDYIRTRFFEPLGMTTAGFAGEDAPDAVVAKGYNSANGSRVLTYAGGAFACADVIASPKDLYRWTIALHSGKVLGEEMYRKMTTVYITDSDSGTSYGYGLMIAAASSGTTYYHPGSLPGFISMVAYIPEQDLFIALMSNHGCENTPSVAAALLASFNKKIK